MGTKSPGAPQRCHYILQHCLAIQLNKPGHVPEDFWMYDSGYMIFQVRNSNVMFIHKLCINKSNESFMFILNLISIKKTIREYFFTFK